MKVIAAILAGGSGSRVGGETPKQMLLLGGKPVLEHSVAVFDAHPGIDDILVVCREDLIPAVQSLVARYAKVRAVIPGGSDRTGSSRTALRAASALYAVPAMSAAPAMRVDEPYLLLHDAARPLIDATLIDRCLAALTHYDVVEPAVPLSDTVVRVDDDGLLSDVPPRAALRAVQTPQCFRLSIIAEAYRRHEGEMTGNFYLTDDVSLVRYYLPDVPVKVVDGSPRNLKLTHPSDLLLLAALLATR